MSAEHPQKIFFLIALYVAFNYIPFPRDYILIQAPFLQAILAQKQKSAGKNRHGKKGMAFQAKQRDAKKAVGLVKGSLWFKTKHQPE